MIITQKTRDIIALHEKGLSTYQIAKSTGMKSNSIRCLLRYHKKMRPALGKDIEDRVVSWLSSVGYQIERMRGDFPFDILLNGQKVEIKSASPTWANKKSLKAKYSFQVSHPDSGVYNPDVVDYYILVFRTGVGDLVYKLNSEYVEVKCNLTFPQDPTKSRKYPLQYLGILP